MLTQVQSPQRNLRKLVFRLNTTTPGTMAFGNADGALTYNGVGDVTIVFSVPFAALGAVLVSAGSDSATNEYVANYVIADTNGTQVRVIVNDDAGTAADVTSLSIEVSGIDDPG